MYAPVVWTAAADDAASREFVSDYIARWDENPADESAAYFDAIYLAAQALRDAEALTRTALTGAEYTGVQGVYVNGVPNTVRLIELGNGAGNLEAARYADDVCTTCPSFFVADVTEEEASREAIYTFALIADTEADSGRAIEQAVELAVREINDAGGILGPQTVRYTLRLRTYEAGTPAEAVLPAPFAADAAAVPYLVTATGLTSPTLAAARFLYQARANDLTQARAAVTYAVETLELTQFASVSARADYGLNAARAVRDAVRAADDGEIVLSLEHAPDQTDLSGLAAQIAAQSVEVVYAWTTPAAAQSLIDSLAAAGWQGTVFYGYLNDSLAATLTVPDGIALHGVVPWSVSALDWSSRTFAANYTDLYGEAPNDLGAAYYDSVHLLRRAVEAVGPQPLTVATWLREDADFIGVQGVYTPAQYAT
ncbi:MAG: ABC transporter substrate-binding protein, partial [Anaerolineae bacterium]|nr:ABC transporter substrate-binding protein [Anaerolineae bacterium]